MLAVLIPGSTACSDCGPGKYSAAVGAFITLYTSFILPSIYARGCGHWLGTYVCISVSPSMHASLISRSPTTLYSRFWAFVLVNMYACMYVCLCLYVCMLAMHRYVVLMHSIYAAFQLFAMCQAFSCIVKLHCLGS